MVALVLALSWLAVPAGPVTSIAAAAAPSGHVHLTGRAAAEFELPMDVRPTNHWRDARSDLDYARYQQYAAPLRTYVEGAQLTVVRRRGEQVLVIGAYHPGLRVARPPLLDVSAAMGLAAADAQRRAATSGEVSDLVQRSAELRLDPDTDRLFYLVASGAPGVNLYHKIDAQTGAVIDAWDAIEHAGGMGTGVKGDVKDLATGPVPSLGDLTSPQAGGWKMESVDGSFITSDAQGTTSYPVTPMSDTDNDWNAATQGAAVDAQYYAALTVAFYRQQLGFDLVGDCPDYGGALRSIVHYRVGYDNAFWDGDAHYMVYGDGDGQTDRALSSGQDVVSHELSHAVTQCRVDLTYEDESGALNEAFSDVMATAAEWDLEEPLSSNCRLAAGQTRCADWLLGEDIMLGDAGTAIRDLADPGAQGQPSHWEDRVYLGTHVDSGGVHYNSGIVNHAFYLMVNGGRNARCFGPSDPQADCDVFVPAISLDHAEQIFFAGFGVLTTTASMCDASEATLAAADLLYPGSVADHVATELAWQAVGRGVHQCAPGSGFSISLVDHSVALAPGANGDLQLDLHRETESGQIDFSVEHAAPATVTFDPPQSPELTLGDGSVINVDVTGGAADGTYPLLISATAGAVTRYASATLIVDGVDPEVAVSQAGFLAGSTVATNGSLPVRLTWTAADGQSGLSSAELDHSPNGTAWTAIYGPGSPTGLTAFVTAAGPHQFHVVGIDAAGNSATSDALVTSLLGVQESAATYTGSWATHGAATAWGTTRFSKSRGAAAVYQFTGTDVVWVAQRGRKRGKAWVYLDGVRTVVDLYSSSTYERRVVFAAAHLAAGQHTLRIVVRGTSGRPRVDIDGFFVLSR